MKILGVSSVICRKRKGFIKSKPQITAENILNREFYASKPNEKWLPDVGKFKIQGSGKKLFFSAIYDLYDKSIVSFAVSNHNDSNLVFVNYDSAVTANPNAHPLIHTDRGSPYTSIKFCAKLAKQGIVHSMSRVDRCIDNGPMEGFFGILKTEMFSLNRSTPNRNVEPLLITISISIIMVDSKKT
jgi:transposase InsO family protein